ncbi:hypothetical protein EB093_05085 [bacterium]|nr:hypothetical protein [bacterium]
MLSTLVVKDLRSISRDPFTWLIAAITACVSGIFITILKSSDTHMQLFATLLFTNSLWIPLVPTRLIWNDRSCGLEPLIDLTPCLIRDQVIARFLATSSVVTAIITISALSWGAEIIWGKPDIGTIMSCWLGLVTVAITQTAIAGYVGYRSKNPIYSVGGSFGIYLLLWVAAPLAMLSGPDINMIVSSIALLQHTFTFNYGIVSVADLGYFAGTTTLALGATFYAKRSDVKPVRSERFKGLLFATGASVCIVLNCLLFSKLPIERDISSSHQLRLSSDEARYFNHLVTPVSILAFIQPNTPESAVLQRIFRAITAESKLVTTAVYDLDLQPAVAEKYHVTQYGTLVIQLKSGKTSYIQLSELFSEPGLFRRAQFNGFQPIVSSITRLSTRTNAIITVLVDHGGRRIDSNSPDSLYQSIEALSQRGFKVLPITVDSLDELDSRCLLILPGISKPLSPSNRDRIRRFIERGGKGVFLLDPMNSLGATELLYELGVGVGNTIIRNSESGRHGSPTDLILTPRDTPITRQLVRQSVEFCGATTLTLGNASAKVPLVTLNSAGGVVAGVVGYGDGGFFISSDIDWLSNAYFLQGAHRGLLISVVDFLTGQYLPAVDRPSSSDSLQLTRSTWVWFIAYVWLPIGLIGCVMGRLWLRKN